MLLRMHLEDDLRVKKKTTQTIDQHQENRNGWGNYVYMMGKRERSCFILALSPKENYVKMGFKQNN